MKILKATLILLSASQLLFADRVLEISGYGKPLAGVAKVYSKDDTPIKVFPLKREKFLWFVLPDDAERVEFVSDEISSEMVPLKKSGNTFVSVRLPTLEKNDAGKLVAKIPIKVTDVEVVPSGKEGVIYMGKLKGDGATQETKEFSSLYFRSVSGERLDVNKSGTYADVRRRNPRDTILRVDFPLKLRQLGEGSDNVVVKAENDPVVRAGQKVKVIDYLVLEDQVSVWAKVSVE